MKRKASLKMESIGSFKMCDVSRRGPRTTSWLMILQQVISITTSFWIQIQSKLIEVRIAHSYGQLSIILVNDS
jgi:hypothetical protein